MVNAANATCAAERLIRDRLVEVDNYLAEAGYQDFGESPADRVRSTRIPDFQVDGVFDRDLYRSALDAAGRDVAEYEQSVMLTLQRMQLQRGIRGSSIVTPGAYRRYLNLAFEQRIVSTADIDRSAVSDEVVVTEEMIAAYYDENPALYQTPETADVEYVELLRSEISSQVSISESQLRDYYEDSKSRFEQDEQRRARHILILFDDDEDAAEAQANAVLARLQNGESFAELAAEFSQDGGTAQNGGELGALTRTQLPDELGATIFTMDSGELAGPVRGDFGFHIVRLDEILESGPLPFEQVRASLLSELQEQEAEGMFLERERDLSDALFDANNLQSVADAVGLPVQRVEGFTRSGHPELGGEQQLIDTVFSPQVLAGEQNSELVELDADRTVVVAVVNHQPATRQPLEEVRDQVEAVLRQNQAEELMAQRAQQLQEALETGEEFALAAEASGATVNAPVSIRRNDDSVDQFLQAAVYSAPKPQQDLPSIGSTRNGGGGYTVYRIDAVMPGRPASIPQDERDAGKLELTDTYGIGDFVAFAQSLRNDADILINEDVVAQQDLFQ